MKLWEKRYKVSKKIVVKQIKFFENLSKFFENLKFEDNFLKNLLSNFGNF